MRSVETPVTRESIAHFGPGRLTVKVECERLQEGAILATEPRVLGMQKAVSYLIGASEFRIPRPNSVLVVETPEEILSDKVRALLERPHLKGRDIYDVWHLRDRLRVPVVRMVMERKFSCYAVPFTPRRRPA